MVVMIEKTEFCYKSWILRVVVHCKQNSYKKVCKKKLYVENVDMS
jgi:hypothetical protein